LKRKSLVATIFTRLSDFFESRPAELRYTEKGGLVDSSDPIEKSQKKISWLISIILILILFFLNSAGLLSKKSESPVKIVATRLFRFNYFHLIG
jgi:hypothetical protein